MPALSKPGAPCPVDTLDPVPQEHCICPLGLKNLIGDISSIASKEKEGAWKLTGL